MPFLFAQILLGYTLAGMFLRVIVARDGHTAKGSAALVCLVLTSTAVASFAALFLPVLDAEHGVSPTAINWSAPAYAVSGLLACMLFALRLVGLRVAKGLVGEVKFGLAVLGIAAGAYTTVAAVDHMVFMRGKEAGVLDASILLGAKLPSECQHLVLVRLEEGTMHYRCPTMFVLGGHFRQWPFAPWPSYVSGQSVEARVQLDKLLRSAEQVPGTQSH